MPSTTANILTRTVHSAGHTDLCYSADGKKIITCGSENFIRVADATDLNLDVETVDHHTASVSCIVSNSKCVISGDQDGTVAYFSYPKMKFVENVSRSQLEIKHLSLDPSGVFVSVVSENKIKIVNVQDTSQSFIIQGERTGMLRSAVFDPKGQYLASTSDDGSVRIWTYGENQSCVKVLQLFPSTKLDEHLCRLDWHPSGDFLAVGGGTDIKIIERSSWTIEFTFKGEHKEPVSLISWSPNGQYLASADLSGVVLIWHWGSRECLDRLKQESCFTGMSWSPTDNSLALSDNMGLLNVWTSVIAITAKHPHPAQGSTKSLHDSTDHLPEFDEIEPKNDAPPSPSKDDSSTKKKRVKKLHKRDRVIDDLVDEQAIDEDDEDGELDKAERIQYSGSEDEDDDDHEKETQQDRKRIKTSDPIVHKSMTYSREPQQDLQEYEEEEGLDVLMQPPFQPSSSADTEAIKRRYLVWNMIGVITARKDTSYSEIEIEFHDKGRHKSIQQIDHFQSSMAALGERAAMLASKRQGPDDTVPSTLSVILLDSWASNSNWKVQMDLREDIEAIALGSNWFACATNQQNLRFFSPSGIQTNIISLPGPVVSMAGDEDLLFVVYHRAVPPAGAQFLSYMLMDCRHHKLIHRDDLPLTSDAKLDWIGFSDTKMPVTYDSQGVLRGLLPTMDFIWTPLLDTRMSRDSDRLNEYYWPIAVTERELLCVLCKAKGREPAVVPRPVISNIALLPPPLSGQDGQLENVYLQRSLQVEEMRWNAMQLDDLQALENQIKPLQAEMDKKLLQIIMNACRTFKDMRALDVCTLLSSSKSMEAAIQIATRTKRSNLSERMLLVKQAKLAAQPKQEFSQQSIKHTNNYASRMDSSDSFMIEKQDLELPSPMATSEATASATMISNEVLAEPTAPSSPIRQRSSTKAASPIKPKINPFSRTKSNGVTKPNPFSATAAGASRSATK